jgi:RimJ/RimL family protein N-acetyltransferase
MQTLRAITHFQTHELVRLAMRRIVYFNHCYLLHIRLQGMSSTPPRKIGGSALRRVDSAEIVQLYDRLSGLTFDDKRELLQRIDFYENGFHNCYAIDVDQSLAYLQWIIYPSENEIIRRKYKHLLLPLRENEVAIDNAFTFPEYRGRGLMPFASWQLLQMAKDEGYRRGLTYVRKENVYSLNVLTSVGFSTTKLIREFKILGYSRRLF